MNTTQIRITAASKEELDRLMVQYIKSLFETFNQKAAGKILKKGLAYSEFMPLLIGAYKVAQSCPHCKQQLQNFI